MSERLYDSGNSMDLRQLAGLEVRQGHVSLSEADFTALLGLKMAQLEQNFWIMWREVRVGGLLCLSDALEKDMPTSSERVLPLLVVLYRRKERIEDAWAKAVAHELED